MTDRLRVAEAWRRLDVVLRDLPLGAGVFLLALLPVTHGYGTVVGGLPDRPADALAVAAVALQSLPLAFRRRWPVVCLGLVSAGFALDQLSGYHTFAGTGLVVALLSAGSYVERHRRLVALVFSAAYLALVAGLYRAGSTEPFSEFLTFYVAMAFAAGIGVWQRAGRLAERDRLDRIAGDTRLLERTRIARDLHDVVTHHVTAMVVQAEAARYLAAAPGRVDEALETIAGTGRRAISDLRQVLDVLNPNDEEPSRTPGVPDIRDLVEHSRRAGLRVELVAEGVPSEQADGADLAVYRVVQEALTNVRKHATGSRTLVEIRHRVGEIMVEVQSDAGPAVGSVRVPGGSGRGLAGLRERVTSLGGDFSAGPREDGGFLVQARVPTGSPS